MTLHMNWGIFCYGLILLFGVGITAVFMEGPQQTRRHIRALLLFSVLSILLQSVCWLTVGLDRTRRLYPLMIHLPLLLFVMARLKRPWYQALTGICSAYLCLQIPRWAALFAWAVFREKYVYYLAYIPAICVTYYLLWHYVSGPVSRLISQSMRACLLVGGVPICYYLFDYGTIIYTRLLYNGSAAAVEFIPFVVAVFYFVFVVIYYEETRKQADAQLARDQMETQFRQARAEMSALRQSQEQTRRYRHDIRHHLRLLQAMAAEGSLEQITEYLHTIQSDLETFTPVRYCENETVNLILASFEHRAEQAGVPLTLDARVPEDLPISETELCSLLSNSLENAIRAASGCPEETDRTVTLKASVFQKKLLLLVENPYTGQVRIQKDGLPQAVLDDKTIQNILHGYGTRSIAAIVENHGGQTQFSAEGGRFSLRAVLPLN